MESTFKLSFGTALEILKGGGAVARQGWNGKNMWLFLVPGSRFAVEEGRPLAAFLSVGTQMSYNPHIDMKTATGEIVPWLASQTDVLAEDWSVVAVDKEGNAVPTEAVAPIVSPAAATATPPQPMAQRPTSGRIVQFFPEEDDLYARNNGAKQVPAMVVQAWGEDGLVNIRVFNDSDEAPRMRRSVAHRSKAAEGQSYWDWSY